MSVRVCVFSVFCISVDIERTVWKIERCPATFCCFCDFPFENPELGFVVLSLSSFFTIGHLMSRDRWKIGIYECESVLAGVRLRVDRVIAFGELPNVHRCVLLARQSQVVDISSEIMWRDVDAQHAAFLFRVEDQSFESCEFRSHVAFLYEYYFMRMENVDHR